MKKIPSDQTLISKLLIEHSKLRQVPKRMPFRLWFLLWRLRRRDEKAARRSDT